MRISVIMVDGSFREHIFGAKFFTEQDFPSEEYEVLWIEFYEKANPALKEFQEKGLKVICLGNPPSTTYHSSFCFNEGIRRAHGDILVIPDADQMVDPDFLNKVSALHEQDPRLMAYGYRFDEMDPGSMKQFTLAEAREKCHLRNLFNYGGCLTVRRQWMEEINGYEQHWFFETGFHANGTDIFHRLKNLGLNIRWCKELILYHPWHPYSQIPLKEKEHYALQFKLLEWRARQFETKPFNGLEPEKNTSLPFPFTEDETERIKAQARPPAKPHGLKAGLAIMFPGLLRSLKRIRSALNNS